MVENPLPYTLAMDVLCSNVYTCFCGYQDHVSCNVKYSQGLGWQLLGQWYLKYMTVGHWHEYMYIYNG